jgi:hypothetical protein
MKRKDWSNFKVYCSGISNLISKPKGVNDLKQSEKVRFEKLTNIPDIDWNDKEEVFMQKMKDKKALFLDPPLSESAKGFLIEIYSRDRYNLRHAAMNRQKPCIAKGYFLEFEGLKLLSSVDKIEYKQSKEYVEDDYFYGVCDILCVEKDRVMDIKTSWNATTFMQNRKDTGKLSAKAWWQMQGYLHLNKKQYGQVCYVLVNTPKHLIDQEQSNLFRRYTYGEINRDKYDVEYEKLQSLYNYDKIPKTRRVIRFNVEYCEEAITKAIRKVELSRVWLNQFEESFIQNKDILTLPESYIRNGEEDNTEFDTPDTLPSD